MDESEKNAIEIATSFGIDLDTLEENKTNEKWVEDKVMKLSIAYISVCYALRDKYYNEEKEEIAHLKGKRNVIAGLLIMLNGENESVCKLLGIQSKVKILGL